MRYRITLLLGLVVLLSSRVALPATAILADGSTVDWNTPGSQVYVVGADGNRTPLWNGVHSLRNGGHITIRDGVLAGRPWSSDGTVARTGLCRQLVDRVCGKDGACTDASSCEMARQIAELERQAATATAPGTESQCDAALRDHAYFKPCR